MSTAGERFVDEEPIEGTLGVFRVWDSTFMLPRAVRVIPGGPDGTWDRAKERVRLLSRVRHPALPPLVAVGEAAGELKLVESWVEGQTLERLLDEDGPMSVPRALGLVSPVVDALRIAYAQGLGHGGIDTRSLMVDQVGVVQLVGLGAREGDLAEDVSSLASVLAEIVGQPWPDTLRSLVDEALGGQLTSLADLSERLRLIREDLSEEDEDLDFEFDFDFEPDEVPFDEAAVANDRRVLALVGIGLLAIVGVGLYGSTLPSEELALGEPLAEVEAPAAPLAAAPEAPAAPLPVDRPPPAQGVTAETSSGVVDDPRMRVPELGPMRTAAGKWRLEVDAGAPAMVVVPAENEVADRLDVVGRPELGVACTDDGLTAVLRPGVHRIEGRAERPEYALYASLDISRDGRAVEQVRADLVHGDGQVYIPPEPFLSRLHGVRALSVRYAPFAAGPVVAVFDIRGLNQAMAKLGRCG